MKYVYSLVIITSLIVSSCSLDFETNEIQDEFTFISLAEDVDFNKLSNHEFEKIFNASNRIHIAEDENGLLYIKEKNGKDINVSENIYRYFVTIIDNTNQSRLNDVSNSRDRLLSRAEHEGYTNVADCMAWAISKAQGMSYDYVSEALYNRYHGAVPAYASYEAFLMFGNINTSRLSSFNTSENLAMGMDLLLFIALAKTIMSLMVGFKTLRGLFIAETIKAEVILKSL